MSILKLTSSGLVDVDFTGIRLTSGGLVKGSPSATTPIAVDDVYSVTSGQLLTVPVETGILINDTYVCN